jgi:DNA-binding NarL/FixJ family response regulator
MALLIAGLTDTASARHLGVSLRTVQRRVAALLDELGVQTRFQAGAKLAFRDAGQAIPAAWTDLTSDTPEIQTMT